MHNVRNDNNNDPVITIRPTVPPTADSPHERTNNAAQDRFQNNPDQPHHGFWHRIIVFFVLIQNVFIRLIAFISRRSLPPANPDPAVNPPAPETIVPPATNNSSTPPSLSSNPAQPTPPPSPPPTQESQHARNDNTNLDTTNRTSSSTPRNEKVRNILPPLPPSGEKRLSEAEQKEAVGRWESAYKDLQGKAEEIKDKLLPKDMKEGLQLHRLVEGAVGQVHAMRFEYNGLNATLNDTLQNLLTDDVRSVLDGTSPLITDLANARARVVERMKTNQNGIHAHLDIRYKNLMNRVREQTQQASTPKVQAEEKESKEQAENGDLAKLKADCKQFFIDLHDLDGFESIKRDRLASYHRNLGVELQLLAFKQKGIDIQRDNYQMLLEWGAPLKMDSDGMPNLHNTCYINSAIQILLRSGMMTGLLAMNIERRPGESNADLAKREEIKKVLSLIVAELNKGEATDLKVLTNALYDFRRIFCDTFAEFNADDVQGYTSQQDGPTFLKYLLQTLGVSYMTDTIYSQGAERSNSDPRSRGDVVVSVPFRGDRYTQQQFTPWHIQELITAQFSPQMINDPNNKWRGYTEYTAQTKVTPVDELGHPMHTAPKYLPIALQRTQQMNAAARAQFVTAMRAEAMADQMCRENGVYNDNVNTYLEYIEMAEQRLGFSPLPRGVNARIAEKMREIAKTYEHDYLVILRQRVEADRELKGNTSEQLIQKADNYYRTFIELNKEYHFEMHTPEGRGASQEMVFGALNPPIDDADKPVVLRLVDLITQINSRSAIRHREYFARFRSEAMQQLRITGDRKVLDPIVCPLDQNIDCRAIFRSEQPVFYRIKAFQVHHGLTPSGGHYTAAGMHNGNWVHFNDNIVKEEAIAQAATMAAGDPRTMYGNPNIDSPVYSADYLILERVDSEADQKEQHSARG